MSEDRYARFLGIPAGPRPPRSHVLLGVEPDVNDPAVIEAAVQRRMDQLDQYALSNDRATREQVQQLMNEVAKARVQLVERAEARARKAASVAMAATAVTVPEPVAAEPKAAVAFEVPSVSEEWKPKPLPATPRRAWFTRPRLSAEAWSLMGVAWLMSLAVTAFGAYFVASSRTPSVDLASQAPAEQTPAPDDQPNAEPLAPDSATDLGPVAAIDPEPEQTPKTEPDTEPIAQQDTEPNTPPTPPAPKPDEQPQPDITTTPPAVATGPLGEIMKITDRNARLQAYLKLRDSMPAYSPEQIQLIIEATQQFNGSKDIKVHIYKRGGGFGISAPVPFGQSKHPNLALTDLSAFAGLEVDYLNIQGCRAIHDFSVLTAMRIRVLVMTGCIGLKDLTLLNDCKGMEALYIGGSSVTHLDGLLVPGLKTLGIAESPMTDLSPLARMGLDRLDLTNCYHLASLRAIESMPPLKEFRVIDEPDGRLSYEFKRLESIHPSAKARYSTRRDRPNSVWPRVGLPEKIEPIVHTHIGEHNKLDKIKDPADRHAAFIKLRDSYEPFSREQLDVIQLELIELNNTNNIKIERDPSQADPVISVGLVHGNIGSKYYSSLKDMSPLAGMAVHTLSLRGLDYLRNFDFLKSSSIHTLDLTGCGEFKDVSILNEIKGLSVLKIGETSVTDLRDLRIESLKSLSLDGCLNLHSLIGLQGMELDALSAAGCTALRDVSALSRVSGLTHLNLDRTAIQSISPIGGQEAIKVLSLKGCEKLSTVAGLNRLKSLEHLYLHGTPQLDHVHVDRLQNILRDTEISFKDEDVAANPNGPLDESKADGNDPVADAPADADVPVVNNINELMKIKSGEKRFKAYLKLRDSLDISSVAHRDLVHWAFVQSNDAEDFDFDLSARRGEYRLSYSIQSTPREIHPTEKITDISAFTGLTFSSLVLRGFKNLDDYRPIGTMSVMHLDLSFSGITDLKQLNGVKNLQQLRVDSTKLTSLRGLEADTFDYIDVSRCEALTSLDGLEGKTIGTLNARDSKRLRDFSALRKIKGLEHLRLDNTGFHSLRYLEGLDLETLSLSGCKNLSSLGVLTKMKSLETLYLRDTDMPQRDLNELKQALPGVTIYE